MKAWSDKLTTLKCLQVFCILLSLTTLSKNVFPQNYESKETSYLIDTILIGAEPDYPPHCFINEDGEPDGFAIELFKEAAKAVGLHVKINIGIWNHIKNDLARGKIDALPLVGRTPERELDFDFTTPYLSLHGAVFVQKGTKYIKSLEDLKNKQIGVMKGDNSEEFLLRSKLTDEIITTNTFEEAFLQLANGELDAVVTQRVTGIELLKNLKIKSVVPLDFQLPEFRQDFCFAVKEGNDSLLHRLDEGLSIIIANNKYNEIKLKWLGPSENQKLSLTEISKIALLVFIPMALLFFILLLIFLKKEVRRKTGNLNSEISEHKKTLEILNKKQTLLKNSEQKIRLLLNSTAEGIYGIDNDGLCTLINASALKLLGYTSESQIIGKNMHNLMHHTKSDGSSCSFTHCNIHKAFKVGKGTTRDDEFFWRSDDSCFQVEYFSFPILHENQAIGAVITFWDITIRKKAEEELYNLKNNLEQQVNERTSELQEKVDKLNRSQMAMLYMVEDLNKITAELKLERKKLEIANNELDAFTYSVSHDLKAPLRAINGFSGFLLEEYSDKFDSEGFRYLNIIRQNAGRMDTLISDMLHLSRITRTELRLALVNMKSIAQLVFLETATEDEKNTFDFILNELPTINCDNNLMKQVLQNLISNALKYSSKSDIRKIEIGTVETKQEISFYIKDWGAGFNPNYSNKLFSPFQRLHTDKEFEGTGVGLAIVKRIIQCHDGRVWAESQMGKGATFWFAIPVK